MCSVETGVVYTRFASLGIEQHSTPREGITFTNLEACIESKFVTVLLSLIFTLSFSSPTFRVERKVSAADFDVVIRRKSSTILTSMCSSFEEEELEEDSFDDDEEVSSSSATVAAVVVVAGLVNILLSNFLSTSP